MDAIPRVPSVYSDTPVEEALLAYNSDPSVPIRAIARSFGIPESTLRHRIKGRASRSCAHEYRQILSECEEKTLARWITHLTATGYPASTALVVDMAKQIREQRHRLKADATSPPSRRPIGKRWLDRFRKRHPDIQGTWTRQIESARHNAVNAEAVKRWFDAVTELFLEHQYPPEQIYNMDESGFAVGTSQTSRVLVNVREKSSWKVVHGRQEWITAIECISAAGEALAPMLIFKAKHTNTSWIPTDAPDDWRFTISNSGWTSDSHALEWVQGTFEPQTRPSGSQRRLLIMDGHGSHITARFISFCMDNAIDLLILPPHCSHVLQPLDVGVFSPLKRALAVETDAVSRLDSGRLKRVEWTEMYIRARQRAMTGTNVKSGWRATGLAPLSPIEVLSKIHQPRYGSPTPRTPGCNDDFDMSLLRSSPPDSTELRQANDLLRSELRKKTALLSPARRYNERALTLGEIALSDNIILRKRLVDAEALLTARKQRKNGKRIKLKDKYVFSTQEVLEIAKEAEVQAGHKKSRRQPRKRIESVKIDSDEEGIFENGSSEHESDCIVVAMSR